MTPTIKWAAIAATAFAFVPAAASAADVAKTVAAFEAVGASPEKLEAYCAMVKKIDEVGDDEEKAKAAEGEIDGYMMKLGSDFEQAWSGGDDLPDESQDLEKIENALADLDNKCGGGADAGGSDAGDSDGGSDAGGAEGGDAPAP